MKKYVVSIIAILFAVESFSQCEDFTFNASVTSPWCHDSSEGSISLIADGGTLPYVYEIRNEAEELVNEIGESEATGLISGDYSIHIVDDAGCELDESITISGPEPLYFVEFSGTDGIPGDYCSLSMAAAGGTGSINYLWTMEEDPDFSSVSTSIAVTEAGCYIGTATDSYGCEISSTVCVGWLGLEDNIETTIQVLYSVENQLVKVVGEGFLKIKLFSTDGRLLVEKALVSGVNSIYQNNFEPVMLYELVTENGTVYTGRITRIAE